MTGPGSSRVPVHVRSGGTLRIVESNISVRLEDMVLRDAGFTIDEGGSLVVERSTILLHADPLLETADMLGPSTAEVPTPYLARAINLERTTNPYLQFWVLFRDDVDLVVGTKADVATDPEVLGVVGRNESDPHAWTPFQVSLQEYVGDVIQLVVFPVEEVKEGQLISDIPGSGGSW